MNIPNGKGQSLETMSEVVKNFASESDKDLKVIKKVQRSSKRYKIVDSAYVFDKSLMADEFQIGNFISL